MRSPMNQNTFCQKVQRTFIIERVHLKQTIFNLSAPRVESVTTVMIRQQSIPVTVAWARSGSERVPEWGGMGTVFVRWVRRGMIRPLWRRTTYALHNVQRFRRRHLLDIVWDVKTGVEPLVGIRFRPFLMVPEQRRLILACVTSDKDWTCT